MLRWQSKRADLGASTGIHAAASLAVLTAVLRIRMISAGWRIAVTDHVRAPIQPTTVQPAAKFKSAIHGKWS